MAKIILANLALSHPEISILLLDDSQIAELNLQYLQRDYPTDVLAFPMSGEPFAAIHPQVIGDVVISVETARRQSLHRKTSLDAELACLLIHGILHLLGYDHELSPREKLRMRRMEKKLLHIVMAKSPFPANVKKIQFDRRKLQPVD